MRIIITLVICLLAWSNAFTQSDWTSFRANPQLTGYTNAKLPKNIDLLFSFQTGDNVIASPVVSKGIIYCGSADGFFYAIDFEGKLKWKTDVGNAIEAPAVVFDKHVVFGTLDGSLICLNVDNGEQLWKYAADNQIVGSLNWFEYSERTVLAVGSYDYNLYGIDLESGNRLWAYESDNYINGAPALYKDGVVFGGCDGFIHLVSMRDGSLIRKIEIETYIASSPAIVDNIAYVGDYDGNFFAINLDKGKVEWKYDNLDKNLAFLASPAIHKNNIIVGNEDRELYCINRKNGALLWKTRLTNRINSSSVIAGDKCVTATMDGILYIHDIDDGSELWQYEIGSPIVSSPAIYKQKIIIGSNDGEIYVFGEK